MSKPTIEELLESSLHTETIARSWPIIKEILVEQQLIMVAADEDEGSLKLKGFATGYRVLERFQKKGQASIDADKKKTPNK